MGLGLIAQSVEPAGCVLRGDSTAGSEQDIIEAGQIQSPSSSWWTARGWCKSCPARFGSLRGRSRESTSDSHATVRLSAMGSHGRVKTPRSMSILYLSIKQASGACLTKPFAPSASRSEAPRAGQRRLRGAFEISVRTTSAARKRGQIAERKRWSLQRHACVHRCVAMSRRVESSKVEVSRFRSLTK